MRRALVYIVLTLLVTLPTGTGCSGEPVMLPPAAEQQLSETTGAVPSEATEVIVYFIEEHRGAMYLVAETRTISKTTSITTNAVRELLSGPSEPGHTSAYPPDVVLYGVMIEGGVATVDFSAAVLEASVGAEGERLGIWQLVNTLTELPEVEEVLITVDGKSDGSIDGRRIEDWWGHIGLRAQPFRRDESVIKNGKVLGENIEIDSPRAYTVLPKGGTTLRVRGKVRAYEGQFHVEVVGKNGKIIGQADILASEGAPGWGSFDVAVRLPKPVPVGYGTVVFFEYSAKDGSKETLGVVPVIFE